MGILDRLPDKVSNALDSTLEMVELGRQARSGGVLRSLGPSALRGLLLKRGKQGVPTLFPASHDAFVEWSCPEDHAELKELYRRAKRGQWDGETYLPWQTDVDPLNPEVPLVPPEFVDFGYLERHGIHLTDQERQSFLYSVVAWILSQFLHGEQGALMAAAQVTEAVPLFDGKIFGATQVMDEARHVEVFHRYLDGKLGKLYQINDNLFTIIDALMRDRRWDMKFLGMQIMVEGLALGAFGTLYSMTQEPLLRELLKMVILDEARHVHYGVLCLRDVFRHELSEAERNEREDWAFEVALLMRNRFMAYEVYEEWFEGRLTRPQWREFITTAPGMEEFRHVMFKRLVPNLREIGLMSPRIQPAYEKVGMMRYFDLASADQLSGEQLVAELDAER
ncbi:MAG: ferritin-like domain-containing protein [Deltaproteobacteria bacterium]|nr:ferritin-like domain-containing protein [Deltaproteobacteria bacterium]